MNDRDTTWQATGATVRGVMHEQQGAPNQDAWGMWAEDGSRQRLAAAVADGHGSVTCPRSHRGAQLAVTAVREVARKTVTGRNTTIEAAERLADELPEAVVSRWQALVGDDLRRRGLQAWELDAIETSKGAKQARRIALQPQLAYGTTLVAAVTLGRYAVLLQIGDGECLLAKSDGRVDRPVPGDERNFAHETTSLCSETALADVRTAVLESEASDDRLLVLCSDGVSDAFVTAHGFEQLGTDILDDLEERSIHQVEEDLPDWLDDFSDEATGDDATLCCVYAPGVEPAPRDEALEEPTEEGVILEEPGETEPDDGEAKVASEGSRPQVTDDQGLADYAAAESSSSTSNETQLLYRPPAAPTSLSKQYLSAFLRWLSPLGKRPADDD